MNPIRTASPSSTAPTAVVGAIDLDRLAGLLDQAGSPCRDWLIDSVVETGSTNADLLARFADPANPVRPALQALRAPLSWADACSRFRPVVRVAADQSAGRGRLGRRWWSAPGDSLLFSLGVVIPRPLNALAGLSLATGLATVEGLRQLPVTDPARIALKWPNDILLDDAKLGGILIETAATAPHACAVVIGIGLNLAGTPRIGAGPGTTSLAAATLSEVLAPSWAAASAPSSAVTPAQPPYPTALPTATLAVVLTALDRVLATFSADGLAPLSAPWWASHRFAGRTVSIIDNGEERLSGVAVGLDASGQLLIDADGNGHAPIAVTAGDVSLRPVKGS